MKYLFHERTAYCQFRKLLLIMRLTAFLLLIGILHAGAKGFTQTVTLSVNNMPLEKVCKEIEKQAGCYFVYAKDLKDKGHLISANVKQASLEEALHRVFDGLPFTWQVIDKVVVVNTVVGKVNNETPAPSIGELMEIKGRVTNAQGEPLVNASVISKKTKKATGTGANGEFTLKGLPLDDELIVSFIGYKSQTIKIDNRSSLTLVMEVTDNELDKAVVQAYGKTSQRLTTSNIGVVTAEEIERQPVMNPLLSLQGKVPGLDISQTSGYASATIKVELRGRSTVSGNFPSDPLYIIDGVPLTILELGNNSNYQFGSTGFDQTGLSPAGIVGGQSPLFSMNPSDIESIEVLKDADATAIYGSRGANGVILITTKKGKPGKTKFDLNIREGITRVSRFWKLLNTSQYIAMRRQAFKNDGIIPDPIGDFDVNGTWDTTRNTDWQKALYGGTGKVINAQAALTGGDSHTSFRFGAGYNHTTEITSASGADQRASFILNISHRTPDQRLSISSSTSYSYTQSNMIYLPGSVSMAPDAPSIFDSLGNLNFVEWGGSNNNTIARATYLFNGLKQPYTAKTNFLNTNLSVTYELTKGLLISSNIGYSNTQANQQRLIPFSSQDPISNLTGSNSKGYNSSKNWIIEPQLAYNSLISKGKVSVLLGATFMQANSDVLYVNGYGYKSDLLIQSLAKAPNIVTSDNYGEYRYAAIFGRITYNWENKYILNINARRDGSSRFGPGKQFGNFGSLGVAWLASEEKWLKANMPSYISFIKLRGSYGITGSDAVGDYAYLSRYSSNNILPYGNQSGLGPIQAPNPDFQWQVNKKVEVAINLGFLKDRVNFQLAYYRDRCGNQLLSLPLPALSGFSSVIANSPALVQNSGWEFTLNANILNTRKFKFSINLNAAINRNILVAYPNFLQSPYVGQLIIGQPLNIINVFHYTGVDPQTGQYTFYDKNHDGLITYNPGHSNDDTYPINLSPKWFGGLGFDFAYGSLQLNLFFSIKKQIGGNSSLYGNMPGTVNTNQSQSIIGRQWQKIGDIENVAKFSTQYPVSGFQFGVQSDGVYTDASFIRLSNLSLAYTISKNVLKRVGIRECSLYIQSNNLFVLTHYKGVDPETQNLGGLPPVRTIVGGINFNF